MAKLTYFLRRQDNGEDGQALVEYGLILSLVALAALVGLATMSGGIDGMYTTIRGVATAMSDRLGG